VTVQLGVEAFFVNDSCVSNKVTEGLEPELPTDKCHLCNRMSMDKYSVYYNTSPKVTSDNRISRD
jgi:hypothetical protein